MAKPTLRGLTQRIACNLRKWIAIAFSALARRRARYATSHDPSRRTLLTATVAAAVLTTTRRAHADLLGGDIGVLLAQFEQQLQLVSNAIQTVNNLRQTVTSLGKVVTTTGTVLKHATSNGLDGLLEAVDTATGLLKGAVSNLRRINSDINWWQQQLSSAKDIDSADTQTLARRRHEWNVKTLESASTALDAYKTLDTAFEDLSAAKNIVNSASGQEGVVAQLQLLGSQSYLVQKTILQLATTQARGMQVLTNGEAGRAHDDEQRRKNTEDLMKDWDEAGAPKHVHSTLPNP